MSEDEAGPRLLIYSQDGLGLGHLRRTTLLAAEFLASRPDGSVLTICDSPVGQFFAMAPGHDYLKLPSIRKRGPGDWSPVSLASPFSAVRSLREATILTAATSFRPDVLLVDHMPHGAMGELVPTLEALERFPVRKLLGLRDILDAPATVRRRWSLEGAFEAVERHFDEVLVYGSRDVFDVGAQYHWPGRIRSRLHYCGYVCSPTSTSSPGAIRRRFRGDAEEGQLVVAMAGGGADAYHLFETLVRTVPLLRDQPRLRVVIVTGPFLPEDDRLQLLRLAEGLPVTLIHSVDDSLSFLAAADLVVGMAGYNTTAEILGLGARALLVPRVGPSAEQRIRADRFAERGWVHTLAPQLLAPESLAVAVSQALESPIPAPRDLPDLRGRERAAARLLTGGSRLGADSSRPELVLAGVSPEPRDALAQALGRP
jgi:predicted glycosyltransferase